MQSQSSKSLRLPVWYWNFQTEIKMFFFPKVWNTNWGAQDPWSYQASAQVWCGWTLRPRSQLCGSRLCRLVRSRIVGEIPVGRVPFGAVRPEVEKLAKKRVSDYRWRRGSLLSHRLSLMFPLDLDIVLLNVSKLEKAKQTQNTVNANNKSSWTTGISKKRKAMQEKSKKQKTKAQQVRSTHRMFRNCSNRNYRNHENYITAPFLQHFCWVDARWTKKNQQVPASDFTDGQWASKIPKTMWKQPVYYGYLWNFKSKFCQKLTWDFMNSWSLCACFCMFLQCWKIFTTFKRLLEGPVEPHDSPHRKMVSRFQVWVNLGQL